MGRKAEGVVGWGVAGRGWCLDFRAHGTLVHSGHASVKQWHAPPNEAFMAKTPPAIRNVGRWHNPELVWSICVVLCWGLVSGDSI